MRLHALRCSVPGLTVWCGLLTVMVGVPSCAVRPASPPPANALITLHARNAVVHGMTLRYEPQTNKNCLGYRTKAEDWAKWSFEIGQPGEFEVEVWQGCGQGQGGSDVAVEVGGERFNFIVEDTGHFQNFTPRRIGRVELPTGRHTLAVKPQRKQAAAVMDVRRVRLWPVNPLPAEPAAAKKLLHGRKVVFLGDSITYAGEWIEFVDWLNEVGHKRPGMAKGKTVAEAEREAADVEKELKAMQAG